jgi:hypothetical protein
MGDLADVSTYDIPPPIGGEDTPQGALPLWASQAQALSSDRVTEPQVGMWPNPPPVQIGPPAPPDRPNPLMPFSAWRATPPRRTAGTVMGDLAASQIPTDPLSIGLAVGTGGASIPIRLGAAAAGAALQPSDAEAWGVKYPFNRIGVGDTIANLAKQNRLIPTKDIFEKTIQPHDIPVGSWLTPLVGDRSASGALLTHVGEKELRDPVWMQGGYQFLPEWLQHQIAWGSDKSAASTIAGRVKNLQGDAPDVFGVYTPMSPQSIDASHHMSDTLSQMMLLEKNNISRTAAEQFDNKMAWDPDFPGIKSPKLQAYLRDQPMSYRKTFADLMNTRGARDAGFPDVEQARIAATHSSLLDTPNYAGGQAIARMTGDVVHGSKGFGLAPHYTYPSKLPGEYVGGLPGALPQELLWRDFTPLVKGRDPSAVGKIWLTGLKDEKGTQMMRQRVDPQWQDAAAEYFRKNPMGATARQGD